MLVIIIILLIEFSTSVPRSWNGNPILLFENLENDTVRCNQCYHKCVIDVDHRGICGVVHNQDGILKNMVHSYPSSINIDPIEKKPLLHFFPGTKIYSIGTVGCNFRCSFCQNWQISQNSKGAKADSLSDLRENLLARRKLSPETAVSEAIRSGCVGIAYTYNEPSIWMDYVYDVAKLASKKGLVNVLVTNGYQSIEAINMVLKYIDGVNIDLKSFSNSFYSTLGGARLKGVLRNIKFWVESGVWVEITTLIIPGENDSKEELESIAKFIYDIDPQIVWHLSAYYDSYRMSGKGRTPFSSLLRGYHIGRRVGLKYIFLGNVNSEEYSTSRCHVCGNDLVRRNSFGRGGEIIGLDENGNCKKCGAKIPGIWSHENRNTLREKQDGIPEWIISQEMSTCGSEEKEIITEGKRKVRILFASQSGYSEELAKDLKRECDEDIICRDLDIYVSDLEDYDEMRMLRNEDVIIFVTSTMFYGRVPRNGERFYKYIITQQQQQNDEEILKKNAEFLVIGIGSTGKKTEEMLKNYQVFAREIDMIFEQLGGKRLHSIIEIDKKPRDTFPERLSEVKRIVWEDVFAKLRRSENNNNEEISEYEEIL